MRPARCFCEAQQQERVSRVAKREYGKDDEIADQAVTEEKRSGTRDCDEGLGIRDWLVRTFPQEQQEQDRRYSRNRREREQHPVPIGKRDEEPGRKQRPEHGARVIHRFVKSEDTATIASRRRDPPAARRAARRECPSRHGR